MVIKRALRTRDAHTPAPKAKVALAALQEDKSMAEWCNQFELHTNQIRSGRSSCLRIQRMRLKVAPSQSRVFEPAKAFSHWSKSAASSPKPTTCAPPDAEC